MTKLRVHELAKELNMDNKELLDILKSKNIDVKSHASTVDDDVADQIRREAGNRASSSKSADAQAEKAAEKTADKDGAHKKKNLAFVIRPQNSKNSSRLQGKRPARPAQGGRPGAEGRPARPSGEGRAARPSGEGRPARPSGEGRPNRSAGEGRPIRQERNGQGSRQNEETRASRQDRGGQGTFRQERNVQGGARPSGDNRGARPERGDRSGQGQRSSRDGRGPRQDRGGRDQHFGGQGTRSGGGQRSDNRRGDSRRDDSMNSPMMEQQKNQRNKAKDKERDNKKKEYRDEAFEGKAAKKGKKQKQAAEVKKPQPKQEKKEEQIKQIVIPEVLTIKELADKMKVVPSVIVKKLFLQGKVVTVNQEIDFDTAEEIAMEFDVLCEKEEVVDVIEELLKEDEEDESLMLKRPPVVCVMGHVDHGKTSLLDAIRHTNVTDREAGGITQHLGAYVVEVNGEKITFLDTPGHEAFTAMRMRGANSTDIAILVVAADDGVMPQTVEAINHAKAAGVEIIVAINKIDKPGANVERVKQELTEYELIPEDWGGSTVFVPVSAHTKEGIPELLEMILLTAEVMELKANPNRAARGLVIEAELDKGKGSVATVLVQKGTLHV